MVDNFAMSRIFHIEIEKSGLCKFSAIIPIVEWELCKKISHNSFLGYNRDYKIRVLSGSSKLIDNGYHFKAHGNTGPTSGHMLFV